jgi:hypothetical protein
MAVPMAAYAKIEVMCPGDLTGVVERNPTAPYWTAEAGWRHAPSAEKNQAHIGSPVNVLYGESLKALFLTPTLEARDMIAPTGQSWAGTTWVAQGERIEATVSLVSYAYETTTAGTTSGVEPTWPTVRGALTAADGTVQWRCLGPVNVDGSGGAGTWADAIPLGEVARFAVQTTASMNDSLLAGSDTLPENPTFAAQIKRAAGPPNIPVWLASTAYTAGDVVTPRRGKGARFYVANNSATGGASEPAWPNTDGGTVVDGGITWQELHEEWWVAWGGTSSADFFSIRWDRLGVVVVQQGTTVLKEWSVPDSERATFAAAPSILWQVIATAGRLLITSSAFKDLIEAPLPTGITTVPAGAWWVYGINAGSFAVNVAPYQFPASGSFKLAATEHVRAFTNDADVTGLTGVALPTPSATLNGTVGVAVTTGTTSGSARGYTVTLTAADAYHSPFVQAVCAEYVGTIPGPGDIPTSWGRSLVGQVAPGGTDFDQIGVVTPYHRKATVGRFFDGWQDQATLTLMHEDAGWGTEMRRPLVKTPYDSGAAVASGYMAFRVTGVRYLTAVTTEEAVLFSGVARHREWAMRPEAKNDSSTFEVYSPWTLLTGAAAFAPIIEGLTPGAAIAKYLAAAGIAVEAIDTTSAPAGTIETAGWKYDEAPGMPDLTTSWAEAIRDVAKKYEASCWWSAAVGKFVVLPIASGTARGTVYRNTAGAEGGAEATTEKHDIAGLVSAMLGTGQDKDGVPMTALQGGEAKISLASPVVALELRGADKAKDATELAKEIEDEWKHRTADVLAVDLELPPTNDVWKWIPGDTVTYQGKTLRLEELNITIDQALTIRAAPSFKEVIP